MELTSKRTPTPSLRTFLSTRGGAVAFALLCAVAAAGVLLIAVSRYRASVRASQQNVTVLVTNRLIPKGTSGTAIATGGYFSTQSYPVKQAAVGAVTNTATISGRVAVRDILPGEQLTAADFVPASGMTAELAPPARGISVTLDQAHGLTGTVHTGDHVDVYGGFNVDHSGGEPIPVVRLLVANVRVLQASAASTGIGGSQNTTTTLDINEEQAAMIAFAQEYGKVWLTLRGNGASETHPVFMDLEAELLGLTPIQNAGFNQTLIARLRSGL